MTIKAFKKLCMKASTKKADQIHDYYINLEEIVQETIDEESSELQKQLESTKNQLEKEAAKNSDLEQVIESKKRTTELAGVLYISVNIKDIQRGIWKLGSTKNEKGRLCSYNTGECDGLIQYMKVFKCANCLLAEKLTEAYLKANNFHYRNEHHQLDLTKMIDICNMFVVFVNELYVENSNIDEQIIVMAIKLRSNSVTKDEISRIIQEQALAPTTINNITTNNNTINNKLIIKTKKTMRYMGVPKNRIHEIDEIQAASPLANDNEETIINTTPTEIPAEKIPEPTLIDVITEKIPVKATIAKKEKTSQYTGVSKHKNKWIAHIQYKGKQQHIGMFENEIDAAKAYDAKVQEFYGNSGKINVYDETEMDKKIEPEIVPKETPEPKFEPTNSKYPNLDRFCATIDATTLSPKTKKDYISILRAICQTVDTDADWVLQNSDYIFENMKTKSFYVQKSCINVLLALFKHVPYLKDDYSDSYISWVEKYKIIKSPENKPDTAKTMIIAWDDIIKKRDLLDPTSYEYFVLCIYTYIDPNLDFRLIQICTTEPEVFKDNYLLITNMAMVLCTKKQRFIIPKNLEIIIRISLLQQPREYLVTAKRNNEPYENSHAYNTFIGRVLHNIFGNDMCLRVLRNSFARYNKSE